MAVFGGDGVAGVGDSTNGGGAAVTGLGASGVMGVVLEERGREWIFGRSRFDRELDEAVDELLRMFRGGSRCRALWESRFSFANGTTVRNRSPTHSLAPPSKRSGVELESENLLFTDGTKLREPRGGARSQWPIKFT